MYLYSGVRSNPETVFDNDFYDMILQKKREFEDLEQNEQQNRTVSSSVSINTDLSLEEVTKAIDRTKFRKAYLEIPNEALKNSNAKSLLHQFFNACFNTGLSPADWNFSDIKPIPKKDKESRDPLQNRCITIMCCISKVYSSILNTRIQNYLEKNNILSDKQNGFRVGRSCLDHLFVLCTILRNRKAQNLPTFLTFIDFQKAFDSVDRNLLFFKLIQVGIKGKMYNAISSLYANPQSRVILNEHSTEYFQCPIGVKQGDSLSPTLFAIYINDLVKDLELTKVGIDIGIDHTSLVNALMYADDIVLLAEEETGMQLLLSIVELWCKKWRLELNLTKTNVMHVRKRQQPQSKFWFLFDSKTVPYCTKYKYLGATIDQFLDYRITVASQCEAGGRALSGIIAKMIKNGGLPFQVYSTLIDCCVNSIVDYTCSVTGFRCQEDALNIHLRAARSFLGIPKNGTKCAVLSEINWLLPSNRAKVEMVRLYHRLIKMADTRLTRRVFEWDKNLCDRNIVEGWFNEVKTVLSETSFQYIYETGSIFPLKSTLKAIEGSLKCKQNEDLKLECSQMPKLRVFNLFKNFGNTPSYITKQLSFTKRRALANIRTGTFKIRVETQRYARPKIPYENRVCIVCENTENEVENEEHFIFKCAANTDLRTVLFNSIVKPKNFYDLTMGGKLKIMFENHDNVGQVANFVLHSYDLRSRLIF